MCGSCCQGHIVVMGGHDGNYLKSVESLGSIALHGKNFQKWKKKDTWQVQKLYVNYILYVAIPNSLSSI